MDYLSSRLLSVTSLFQSKFGERNRGVWFRHGCRLVLDRKISRCYAVCRTFSGLVSWLSVSITCEFRTVRRFSLQIHCAYFLGEFYFYDFWVLSNTGHGLYLPCVTSSTCDVSVLPLLFRACWTGTVLGRFGNDEYCTPAGVVHDALLCAICDIGWGISRWELFVVSCARQQCSSRMPELLLLPENGTCLICTAFTETLACRKVFYLLLRLEYLHFGFAHSYPVILSALLHSTRWNLMQKHNLAI